MAPKVDTSVVPPMALRTEVCWEASRYALICKLRVLLAYYPEQQVIYADKPQKKGPGMGTALLAGSLR